MSTKVLVYLAIMALEFVKGFLIAIVASGLTGLDASTVQAMVVGALLPVLSTGLAGITSAINWLHTRKAAP